MRQEIIKLNPDGMKEKTYFKLMTNTRRCSSWFDFRIPIMIFYITDFPITAFFSQFLLHAFMQMKSRFLHLPQL